MTKYWIKMYHETLYDRKIATLDDHLWRRFVEVLLMAGEKDDGGILPSLVDMAWILRTTEEMLETDLNELIRIGVLEFRDGGYYVRNFAKRQDPMPKSEYMRRKREEEHREEHYQARYQPVTNGNTDVEVDTDTEEDTDTDVEEEDFSPGPLALLQDAFITASQLPYFGDIKPRDLEAGNRLIKAGVIPEMVTDVTRQLLDKDYTLTGLASIENGCMQELAKKKRGNTPHRKNAGKIAAARRRLELENGN